MREFVSFNYIPVRTHDAVISAMSAAALHGRGIFTTISICNGEPFLWDKHWRRLESSAVKLDIDLSQFSEYETKQALYEIAKKNGVSNGRARVTIFDESASKLWSGEPRQEVRVLVITGDSRPVTDYFRLTVSPHSINSLSPLTGVKSCNYLEKLMGFDEAKSRGFDEAVQINERGEVASAVMANVFWLKDGELFTPSLKTGCLPGTTREFVLENLECLEVEAKLDEVRWADAIFLTSAGLGVTRVADFGSRKMEKIDHPILHLLPCINTAGMHEVG